MAEYMILTVLKFPKVRYVH